MKIYIITNGDYSDYHICNVTTDYQKAKRYKEAYSGDIWGDARIEAYEDGANGKERYCWSCSPVCNTATIKAYNEKEGVKTNMRGEIYDVIVYAPDEKHAIKKAQDMIAKYKAEQAGL